VGDFLDDLISEGEKRTPKRNVPGEITKRSPVESESTFVRHAFWIDHRHCRNCGSIIPSFDVLMEERVFKVSGGKHYLRALPRPPVSRLINPVVYIRHYYLDECIQCMKLDYPIAEEYNAPTEAA